MDTQFTSLEETSLPVTPCSEAISFTITPSQTTLDFDEEDEESTPAPADEKKPVKKRKSWGQELPVPKTNLPPRKRAKTEDEKEQRRIERVLRNRAAAQTSRERKRLEVEKLEDEKRLMERDRSLLVERLAQMEARVNRLESENRLLKQQAHSSRGSSPRSEISSTSPTLAPTLFKQEGDEHVNLDKIPFPTASLLNPSLHLDPSDLNSSIDIKTSLNDFSSGLLEASDLAQHPAVSVAGLSEPSWSLDSRPTVSTVPSHHAAPLSDDDFNRLFSRGPTPDPDSSYLEGGFSTDLFGGGDPASFPFDSMVDLDPEPVGDLEGFDSSGFPNSTSAETPSVQPRLGASTS